jgi:UDP-N-acetylmuramyl pentapeptide phosphotransferase/UDP-N-acetylglucosamine-1-phosphate transferase|tara:strand:- start:371 stop:1390 length:1020 start_codon:yes stop_codon:yes gene_type:complete
MKLIQLIPIIIVGFFLINYLLNKFNFLLDSKKSSFHKSFIEKDTKPAFSGGIFILLSLTLLIPGNQVNFKIIIFLIFMSGFLSDIGILNSANLRFIIQVFLVVLSIIILEQYIQSTRLYFMDNLLSNHYFNLFFTSFCILVLINGTNFIDGLNTIVTGYYLLILFFIFNFYNLSNNYLLDYQFIIYFSAVLTSILILNAANLLYLGDNGAYLISFFIGLLLIDLSSHTKSLSPYYIINLLWYPAYENLFSIIRKVKSNKSPLKPDNLHLHQLIYQFIKKKIKFNPKITNTISGLTINLFNFLVFFAATSYYSNTKVQVMILLISLTIYNFVYIILRKNK